MFTIDSDRQLEFRGARVRTVVYASYNSKYLIQICARALSVSNENPIVPAVAGRRRCEQRVFPQSVACLRNRRFIAISN